MNRTVPQQLKSELVERLATIASHGFTAGFDFIGGVPGDIVTTFSPEWLGIYQSRGFILHDPVVIWGTQNDGVKSWDQLSAMGLRSDPDVIGAARDAGMQNGSVIALTLNDKKGVIGITHSEPRLPSKDLQTVVAMMSQALFAMPSDMVSSLTPKAIQYLKLAARGLSDSEISEEMSVTSRAVYALKARAVAKLGAKTLPQAMIIAKKSRILN